MSSWRKPFWERYREYSGSSTSWNSISIQACWLGTRHIPNVNSMLIDRCEQIWFLQLDSSLHGSQIILKTDCRVVREETESGFFTACVFHWHGELVHVHGWLELLLISLVAKALWLMLSFIPSQSLTEIWCLVFWLFFSVDLFSFNSVHYECHQCTCSSHDASGFSLAHINSWESMAGWREGGWGSITQWGSDSLLCLVGHDKLVE